MAVRITGVRAAANPPGGSASQVVHTSPVVETLDDGSTIARAGRPAGTRVTPRRVDLA